MKKYRLVAVLDILGFKQLVVSKDIEEINTLMQELITTARQATRIDFKVRIRSVGVNSISSTPLVELNYFIFSDTIIIWRDLETEVFEIEDENNEVNEPQIELVGTNGFTVFNQFCIGVHRFIEEAMVKKIPLRGGIAFGECIIDIDEEGRDNKFIGQLIVDAYLLSEAQDWIGIVFHSSCLKFLEEIPEPRVKEYSKIPFIKKRLKKIKNGKQTNYSLEWCARPKNVIEEMLLELKSNKHSKKIIKKFERTLKYCKDHEPFMA